jgi:hypothetical protein
MKEIMMKGTVMLSCLLSALVLPSVNAKATYEFVEEKFQKS